MQSENQHDMGVHVLWVALFLGVLADYLFREFPLGLNVSVWVAALVLSAYGLAVESDLVLPRALGLLGASAILLGAAIGWRDSALLKTICITGLFGIFATACVYAAGKNLRQTSIWQFAGTTIKAGLSALAGIPPILVYDLDLKPARREGRSAILLALGRGLAVSVPILLIFGGLLVSADEAFHRLVSSFVDVSFPQLLGHVFLILFFGWTVAGYLRGLLTGKHPLSNLVSGRPANRFGIIEIGLPLALLDILFSVFVIVQFRYFFGGNSHVQSTAGLAYSEYARRGFFELVVVAALVLPLLLICHTLLDKSKAANERTFRIIAGIQVALLFVIMASAFQRMRLYQREYGMTELRLYTVAFMAWLAAVFVALVLTVLRGHTEGFAAFSLVSAFLVACSLVILNPDALIIKANAARAEAGLPFDAYYNASLSADAAPALIDALPRLSETDRARVASSLLIQAGSLNSTDWRSWSFSRGRARAIIEANRHTLEQWAAVPPGN